uniref:Uncharacterized protein n=1 Tax=Arundo donax TaxID=35708 RepID=A0A0A9CEB7_ARUDO
MDVGLWKSCCLFSDCFSRKSYLLLYLSLCRVTAFLSEKYSSNIDAIMNGWLSREKCSACPSAVVVCLQAESDGYRDTR